MKKKVEVVGLYKTNVFHIAFDCFKSYFKVKRLSIFNKQFVFFQESILSNNFKKITNYIIKN